MFLRNPRVLLVLFGLLIAGLAAVSLRYFSQYQPLSALANGGVLSGAGQFSLEADTVQVIGRSGGQRRWTLSAQTVTLSRDRRVISAANIRRGTLYARNGRPSILVSADRASYQTPFGSLGPGSAGTLLVTGHVSAHVLSAERPALQTEQLRWDSLTNTLSCPRPVSAALPKLAVSAGNAAYTAPGALDQGTLNLGGGIHARIETPHGPATLDCPGLRWTAAEGSAQTLGPVTAAIPGGLGTAAAADVSVNTRTGDLVGHGIHGTLRLSGEVQ